MSLHSELTADQQEFIDSFLYEDLEEIQILPFSVLFDITGVLCGYRSMAESAWQDIYNPEKYSTSDPEPDRLQNFFQQSGIPHVKAHKDDQYGDERTSITTYLLFESNAYNDALETLQTFTKDSDELDYHSELGDMLGYPDFASEDFKEHGWEEPDIEEQVEFVLQHNGDLLDLTLMLIGVPYSLPVIEEFKESAYDDVQKFRTQVILHTDEYEYIHELLIQSQDQLIKELGDTHDHICEENIVDPTSL